MNATELKQQVTEMQEGSQALTMLWRSLIPAHTPDAAQFSRWLASHSFDAVHHGVRQTGTKFSKMSGHMSPDYLVRFCSKCITNYTRSTNSAAKEHMKP